MLLPYRSLDKQGGNHRHTVPRAAAPLLLSYLHGPGHIGPRPLLKKYQDCFSTRKAHDLVQQLVSSCLTCAQNNVQGPQHGKHGHLPPPLGPLQDLQIDFTHMPRQRGNLKYLCVMVDKFSMWPEAIPVTGETAGIAARCLINHWISRYGLPATIYSDQGPAFTSKLVKELTRVLGIQWKLHIPYHP